MVVVVVELLLTCTRGRVATDEVSLRVADATAPSSAAVVLVQGKSVAVALFWAAACSKPRKVRRLVRRCGG